MILQHFCRQGLLDISDVLIKEANFPIEEDPRLSKAAFQQLNEIQEAFNRRDLGKLQCHSSEIRGLCMIKCP